MKVTEEMKIINDFIGKHQQSVLFHLLRGEEREHFQGTLIRIIEIVRTMPHTYQTDGQADPVVCLHYFHGSADWYILEKDIDTDGEGQIQAFGLADLFGDGGELGYISIAEVKELAEIDLYFPPQPLSSVRKARAAA